jgi:integrase
MGHSSMDPAFHELRPWNEGRLIGAKRALKQQQVWAIRFWLDQHRRLRDRALFDFAIDSKLRGCDVVKVRIGDIVSGGRVRDRAVVVQQKTKRPVQFELMDTARKTMRAWLERRRGTLNDFVFPSRNDYMAHMSTRQYARLVHEWVVGIGLPAQDYGTHSLRRTKASIIYKATGNRAPFRFYLVMPKSIARCVIWALTWKTLWNWPNALKSEQPNCGRSAVSFSFPRPDAFSSRGLDQGASGGTGWPGFTRMQKYDADS